MMFSTCAVSCTPSAAVGSSMMISFEAKVAVRAIATHCRCPPDMWRMVLSRLGILTPVRSSALRVASRIARRSRIENGPRLKRIFSRPRNRLDGTSRSSASARVLEHRLDAGLARLERAVEIHFRAVEADLAARALLDAGDLPHEGGFAGAVVAHDGDMLAVAQLEVGAFQRMHAAIVLGQAFGLQDDF